MKAINFKKTTKGIKVILYVASFLVLMVGITLFFFSENTDVYFAWTINPPLTAAFLGAGYLASFIIELLSAREDDWAKARVAVPGVWVFTLLTLIITLLHWDRFHFESSIFITQAGTWVWLGVYISVPIAMGLLWVNQIRQPGKNLPRKTNLPRWIRSVLIAQGFIMLAMGGAMLLFSDQMIPFWPWKLSVLTSRAIGAWGVGIGVIVLHANWENDWNRLFPMMISYAVYGYLQLVNIIRYASIINWSGLSAILYTVFVVSICISGTHGALKTREQVID